MVARSVRRIGLVRIAALVVAVTWVLLSAPVQAAGTITQSHRAVGNIRTITFTCTGDASDGSFPSTTVTAKFEGRLLALVTNPGSTAPTANYDIALTNADGVDVLQGVGANRHTSNSEMANVVFAATSVNPVVDEADTLTLAITNNSVNSATIVITLFYALGG